MRIWLAPSAYMPSLGGVEQVTARLARELTARGHEVLVLTHHWPRGTPHSEVMEGVAVERLDFVQRGRRPTSWAPYVTGSRTVVRRLAALPRPDVVHVHCIAGQARHLAAYCREQEVRLVVTTHGETAMDEHEVFQRSAARRTDLRRVAHAADCLTAVSVWTREHARTLASEFGDALIVGNGVDVEEWAGQPEVSAPVFAAYGRHVPQKGFDLLLEAFAVVRRTLPDAQLLIGGTGSQTTSLQAAAGPGVTFEGVLDRRGVRTLLGAARSVVVPSRIEPFGLVALEALAAGRRLVFADTGGLADIGAETGWGFAPGDVPALGEAMLKAHVDPPRGPAIAELAARYSWAAVTDAYLDTYACTRPPPRK